MAYEEWSEIYAMICEFSKSCILSEPFTNNEMIRRVRHVELIRRVWSVMCIGRVSGTSGALGRVRRTHPPPRNRRFFLCNSIKQDIWGKGWVWKSGLTSIENFPNDFKYFDLQIECRTLWKHWFPEVALAQRCYSAQNKYMLTVRYFSNHVLE